MAITPKKTGYSLIELTVVVGLTSILAVAITAIVMTSLVSSTRIRSLAKVRETGDYVISQVRNTLRNAVLVNECSSTNGDSLDDYITITSPDGYQTTLETSLDNGTLKIASNSALGTLFLTTDRAILESFDLKCDPSDSDIGLVQIRFTLTTDNASEREKPHVSFETSVEPRNQ